MDEGARLESECTRKRVPGVRIPLSPQIGMKQIKFKYFNIMLRSTDKCN